jgi:hypothetical protein
MPWKPPRANYDCTSIPADLLCFLCFVWCQIEEMRGGEVVVLLP